MGIRGVKLKGGRKAEYRGTAGGLERLPVSNALTNGNQLPYSSILQSVEVRAKNDEVILRRINEKNSGKNLVSSSLSLR